MLHSRSSARRGPSRAGAHGAGGCGVPETVTASPREGARGAGTLGWGLLDTGPEAPMAAVRDCEVLTVLYGFYTQMKALSNYNVLVFN